MRSRIHKLCMIVKVRELWIDVTVGANLTKFFRNYRVPRKAITLFEHRNI